MSARRTLILIVAVALGALAAVGLLNYVRNAESGASEAGAPVEVWVAKAPVPKGTPIEVALDQGLIAKELVAQKLRPATAVVEPSAELAGLVSVFDIQPNMPIVTGSFVSSEIVNTGITDRLEETGLVTVTISVDQTRGAAYLIEPGDFVNVMSVKDWETPFFENDPPIALTPQATAALATNLSENDSVRPIVTELYSADARMVYQKAEVLAVGSALIPDIGQDPTTVEGQESQGQVRGLITLKVPPEAVQVILNVDTNSLYLSLVPNDYEPRAILPLDPTTQVLPGEDDNRLTPYEGFENIIDPTDVPEGVAFDGEDRIGTVPNSGGSTTGGTDSNDGATGDDAPTGTNPDDPPVVETPETTVTTTETTDPNATPESTEQTSEDGEGN